MPKTLGEIAEIPGYKLFLDHDIDHYEHLQSLFYNLFWNLESAYETVDYFRMRLNYYLGVHAPIYNKMIASEFVEIDPFMTDYRERETYENRAGSVNTSSTEHMNAQKGETGSVVNGYRDIERYSGKDNQVSEDNEIGLQVSGRLNSKADNLQTDREYEENVTRNEHEIENRDLTKDVGYTEHKESNENTDHTISRYTDQNTDRNIDAHQTGRDWTERGTSKAHNLGVDSDTPQAMLFNTPNHYYGTGTADDAGAVRTGQNGDYYEHYLEGDITALDSANRKINGGDTPWFNYASGASNNLSHDNYERSGTETYSRDQQENVNTTTDFEESGNRNTDYTHDIKSDEHTAEHEMTDTETNEIINTKQGERTLESRATNENEHSMENKTASANAQTTGRNAHRKLNVGSSIRDTSNSTDARQQTYGSQQEASSVQTGYKEVFKGRTQRSPAQLLRQYRDTLTYSADLYMLDQLERCFLQIF